jgi:hypothetical protein
MSQPDPTTQSAGANTEAVTDAWGREFLTVVHEPPATDCPRCGVGIVVHTPATSGPTGTPAGRVQYASARCKDTADCGWTGSVTYALASVVDADLSPPDPDARDWDTAADQDETGRAAGLFDKPRSEHTIDDLESGDSGGDAA